jgi:hypothetical protein
VNHDTSTRPKNSAREKQLSPAEYEEFAEVFVDLILDPSIPWLRSGMLAQMNNPESTKEFARSIGRPNPIIVPVWTPAFKDALEKMDRPKLLELVKSATLKHPPTRSEMRFFQKTEFVDLMRKSIEETARLFPARRGRKPKADRRDYSKIAVLGDALYPVCLKIETELRSRTRYSVCDLLEHWRPQFPEACSFLLAHLPHFESTLNDNRLRKRAKRIESLARLLADGMAGAKYGLEPRTAIERAREGRRLLFRMRT